MGGKRFTRMCDNGVKFSKLDRFLIFENFNQMWEELSVLALERKLLDHCPIVLRDRDIDFGPKPTKIFDEWLEAEDSTQIINDAWNQIALKEWAQKTFEKIDIEIEELQKVATNWELMVEERILTDEERELWIEARKEWIEKDKEAFEHFKKLFMKPNANKMKFTNQPRSATEGAVAAADYAPESDRESVELLPNHLSVEKAEKLEQPFTEKEIFDAVNECDCSRAPGPDGFKFKFFKLH
ncbi:uncharacterized protein [Rutidosis leptorrhynchoides]|uniref:uncharacterized protein n=1 Tax=Rutidosis leptorrhynchoides TaxID=125765 RepID=UPI003A9A4DFE